MKTKDLPEDVYFRIRDELNEVNRAAVAQFTDAISNVQKYLLFTNAGAAAALVTFMGASDKVGQAPLAWWALAFFLAGILLVGVIAGFNFHVLRGIVTRTSKDVGALLRSEIDFDEFHRRRGREKDRRWIVAIGWGAYLAFIAGIGTAIVGLYPIANLPNAPSNARFVSPQITPQQPTATPAPSGTPSPPAAVTSAPDAVPAPNSP